MGRNLKFLKTIILNLPFHQQFVPIVLLLIMFVILILELELLSLILEFLLRTYYEDYQYLEKELMDEILLFAFINEIERMF